MKTDCGLSEKTTGLVHSVLAAHPEVERAVLFGSRAKGTHRPGSDIDLALDGPVLDQKVVDRVSDELDDLPVPYQFSLVLSSAISDPEVASHIQRVGAVFYRKKAVVENS